MCRFHEAELVSEYWGLLIFMLRDGVSKKRDFHFSSSPWFLPFTCFPSCTEVFETSVKAEISGWLEAGCCNLFISVPFLLFKLPLCFQVVDVLWCKLL